MRGLHQIVEANRQAEALGVADGTPVGTSKHTGTYVEVRCPEGGTKGHQGVEGSGLRGHSVGVDYPFSVAGGFEPGNFGALHTIWTVVNYHTGKVYDTFRGENACKLAHESAHRLADAWKEGQSAAATGDTLAKAVQEDARNV